jgi:hypothetical protein
VEKIQADDDDLFSTEMSPIAAFNPEITSQATTFYPRVNSLCTASCCLM